MPSKNIKSDRPDHPPPSAPSVPTAAELENAAAALSTVLERLGVSLPRGTQNDLQKAARAATIAAAAPPRPQEPPLAARVEAALRSGVHALDELAGEVRAPTGRVAAELKKHKQAGRVYNLGTEDRPRWTWVVGDDASPDELAEAVLRILRTTPMYRAELLAATGARDNRVGGAMRKIQREGLGVVVDVSPQSGDPQKHRARWFVLPANARKAAIKVNHGLPKSERPSAD